MLVRYDVVRSTQHAIAVTRGRWGKLTSKYACDSRLDITSKSTNSCTRPSTSSCNVVRRALYTGTTVREQRSETLCHTLRPREVQVWNAATRGLTC